MNRMSATLQETLLVLLCFDDKNAAIIRQHAEATLFDSMYRPLIGDLYAYIDRYRETPKVHTDEVFERVTTRMSEDEADDMWEILEIVKQIHETVNAEWAISRLDAFVKTQKLKVAVNRTADLLTQDEIDDDKAIEIQQILQEASRASVVEIDSGMSMADDGAFDFLDEDKEFLPTGVSQLDKYSIGPARKELMILAGPAKGGKSWFLVNLMKRAFQHRWKALYVSYEMPAQQVRKRFTQAMYGAAKRDDLIGRYEIVEKDGRLVDLRWGTQQPKYVLRESNFRKFIRERQEQLKNRFRNIRVTSFPSRSQTPEQLEAYLDFLEHTQGFVPDLLCVDYPAIMRVRPEYKRHDIENNMLGVRRIAGDRNLAAAVVHQLNREGTKRKKASVTDVAEDWSVIQTADMALVYSQTPQEKSMGLARLDTGAIRDDEGGKTILLEQAYGIGQWVLNSIGMDSNAHNLLGALSEHGTGEGEDDEDDGSVI